MNYSDYINNNGLGLARDVDISLNTHGTYFYEERMCRRFCIIYGIRACRFCKHGLYVKGCNLRELSRLYEFVI